jgi:hypothetical protein
LTLGDATTAITVLEVWGRMDVFVSGISVSACFTDQRRYVTILIRTTKVDWLVAAPTDEQKLTRDAHLAICSTSRVYLVTIHGPAAGGDGDHVQLAAAIRLEPGCGGRRGCDSTPC